MITKIELEEMRFYSYHGVLPQEKVVGNHFTVSLSLTVPLEKAVLSDCLADTINYADVYETVRTQMEIPSELLEHAAGRILYSLKNRFPEIAALEVRLSKQNPPFGGDLKQATVILSETYN